MNLYDIELLKKIYNKKDILRTINLLEFTENILDTGLHFQISGMTMEWLIPPPPPPPNDQWKLEQ